MSEIKDNRIIDEGQDEFLVMEQPVEMKLVGDSLKVPIELVVSDVGLVVPLILDVKPNVVFQPQGGSMNTNVNHGIGFWIGLFTTALIAVVVGNFITLMLPTPRVTFEMTSRMIEHGLTSTASVAQAKSMDLAPQQKPNIVVTGSVASGVKITATMPMAYSALIVTDGVTQTVTVTNSLFVTMSGCSLKVFADPTNKVSEFSEADNQISLVKSCSAAKAVVTSKPGFVIVKQGTSVRELCDEQLPGINRAASTSFTFTVTAALPYVFISMDEGTLNGEKISGPGGAVAYGYAPGAVITLSTTMGEKHANAHFCIFKQQRPAAEIQAEVEKKGAMEIDLSQN